ncbi:hypothetical protein DRQ53_15040, partial [bacterium]
GGLDAWGQVAKITADDGTASDYFGGSVSINGDIAIVGADRDDDNGTRSGSAYIFQRDQGGPGAWGQAAKITPGDGAEYDYFGGSVSISGDTAIVGAYGDDDTGSNSGSAYVFQRDQGGASAWGQVTKKPCPLVITARGDGFGVSASISGDTAIVGAIGDDDNGSTSGSAYIFQRDQGGPDAWGQVAKITADDGTASDYFGGSVSISGVTVVVGADRDDDNGSNSGSAYIFQRDEGGLDAWGQVAKITADDGTASDYFGGSVSISGDTVVVGAEGDDDLGFGSGSAYVFRRDQGGPDTWGQVVKITPSDGAANDSFGISVSISGDTVVVGADRDDDNGDESGSAYLFQRDQGGPGAWGQLAEIYASDGADFDRFGRSVAISGDTAVIGAHHDDDNGDSSGSAYVFHRDQGGPDAWGQVAKITADDGAAWDRFGESAAISGDRAIVGAQDDDDFGPNSGSAYVFRRDQGGLDAWGQFAKITAADGASQDYFGISVSISGDTALVGAYGDDDLDPGSGSAYVFIISDWLFGDGFESGDTSAWSVTVP